MFGSLASMTLEAFLQRERADDHLWIFLHVPKTAGSSFGEELAAARPPYRNIHVDHSNRAIPFSEQMNVVVGRFIQEMRETRFRSCSGHFTVAHADSMFEANKASKLITFLRNPIDRIISDFRYSRSPAHPPHRDFMAQFPTLESYVEHPESQNKMSRRVVGQSAATTDIGSFVDNRYAFVGTVELYVMCFNIVFRLFGMGKMPTLYRRRTEAETDNEVQLSSALERKIRDLNGDDIALYEHVQGALVRKREEWEALRERSLLAG